MFITINTWNRDRRKTKDDGGFLKKGIVSTNSDRPTPANNEVNIFNETVIKFPKGCQNRYLRLNEVGKTWTARIDSDTSSMLRKWRK